MRIVGQAAVIVAFGFLAGIAWVLVQAFGVEVIGTASAFAAAVAAAVSGGLSLHLVKLADDLQDRHHKGGLKIEAVDLMLTEITRRVYIIIAGAVFTAGLGALLSRVGPSLSELAGLTAATLWVWLSMILFLNGALLYVLHQRLKSIRSYLSDCERVAAERERLIKRLTEGARADAVADEHFEGYTKPLAPQ